MVFCVHHYGQNYCVNSLWGEFLTTITQCGVKNVAGTFFRNIVSVSFFFNPELKNVVSGVSVRFSSTKTKVPTSLLSKCTKCCDVLRSLQTLSHFYIVLVLFSSNIFKIIIRKTSNVSSSNNPNIEWTTADGDPIFNPRSPLKLAFFPRCHQKMTEKESIHSMFFCYWR